MNVILCDEACKKTYKVAKAVSESLNITMCGLNETENIKDCNTLIIFGGGPQSGEISRTLDGCVKKLKTGTSKNALLVTLDSSTQHVSVADIFNVNSGQARVRKILEEKNIQILGEHICLCRFRFFYLLHPNKRDITKTIEWISDRLKGK